MPSVIDALIVTLGLDPTSYVKGQAAARASLKAMSEEERAASKDAEEFTKRRIEGYRKLAGTIVGLYAVITGGRSLAQFTRDITSGDAATGRLAHNLDMSASSLAAWEGAAERAGGSAAGVDGTFRGLTQNLQQFALTGQSSVVPFFRFLGIQISDASGKVRPLSDLLLDISQKFQGMDPARTQALGASLGLDEGTINLLQQGPAAVQALIDKQKELGLVSDEDTRRAAQFRESVLNLDQRFTNFGRSILYRVTPAITGLFDYLSKWLGSHPETERWIGDKIQEFATWLENVNWTGKGGFWEGVKKFEQTVLNALKALASWNPPQWLRMLLGLPDATQGLKIVGPRGSGPSDDPQSLTYDPRVDTTEAPNDAVRNSHSAAGRWLYDNIPALRGMDNRLHTPEDQLPPGVAPPIVDPNTGMPTPSVPGSDSTSVFKPILDLLGKSEGTDKGRGYNETLGYGKYTGGPVDLVNMTIDQVQALQQKMLANGAPSTAVGRYQFLSKTLSSLTSQLGLDPSKTLFSADIQNQLGAKDIENRGGNKFLQGISSLHDFMLGLAKEWASVADPDTGHSHYGQGTGASTSQVQDAIRAVQSGFRTSSNYNNSTANHETHINGPINIHTAAKDAKGIARGLGDAVREHSFVPQADFGLA